MLKKNAGVHPIVDLVMRMVVKMGEFPSIKVDDLTKFHYCRCSKCGIEYIISFRKDKIHALEDHYKKDFTSCPVCRLQTTEAIATLSNTQEALLADQLRGVTIEKVEFNG